MRRFTWGIILGVVLVLTACGKEESEGGLMPSEDFLVIAHRGASAYVPENTLASYGLAEELDANYIELDIHLTKDGQLAVMHDADVSGTTEANGKISEFTLAELKELSANFRHDDKEKKTVNGPSEDYAVPTLGEVFGQFGDNMNFIIELKDPKDYPGIEEKLVDALKEHDMIGFDENKHPKVAIQSFSEKGLKRVHELNQDIPLLKLISFDEDEVAKLSKKELDDLSTYASGIGVSFEALRVPFIKEMHDKGLAVYAYTIIDAETALKMKAIGANGIHTDRPDILGE
ncbi:glycerophosphodiester phosphodiesterase family protein [Sporosarcina sp. JAI121]|uniref:glycerophosphodiester phosphodiesterase family protein n=1 Tax=Sporosarcina sp. JAI121 TaxID=2723064 RepID=UPI0015CB03B2|nr:glycerophosphodiester phosphodiesterase family protein [Sporosarcina sp. JAI121]NYF23892.1 glycerophosphoryl diester phosphodiesterase [Sporosarcina sp. JAI121]